MKNNDKPFLSTNMTIPTTKALETFSAVIRHIKASKPSSSEYRELCELEAHVFAFKPTESVKPEPVEAGK